MEASEDVERLYEEARAVRAELERVWSEAQLTDVLMKGAVSAAQRQALSDSERGTAVTIGLRNAQTWRRLAELSERLGGLIEELEEAKRRARTAGEHE